MDNVKHFFLRALLALSILAAAPAALAGPVYRVSLDTAGWAGETGYLDFTFGGLVGAGNSTATVTNLAGDFDATVDPYFEPPASGDRVNGFRLVAGDTLALVSQAVTFGGIFSFDLSFEVAPGGLASDFGIALLDDAFNPRTWGDTALSFTVTPDGDISYVGAELASVQEVAQVPEPADWLLLATGLCLIGAVRRVQQRR